jgi:hypothetical protein
MKILFLTCTANYLPRALKLAETFLAHNPGYQVFTGLTDRLAPDHPLAATAERLNITTVEELADPDFDKLWQYYNVYELANAVKPLFAAHILQKFPSLTCLIYLDVDVHVFGSFAEMEAKVAEHGIVLTPYTLAPMPRLTPIDQVEHGFSVAQDFEERLMLYTGVFNGGCWAIDGSPESRRFISWWKERAKHQGFGGHRLGLFTEQKWLNLVPLFFPSAHLLRHLGYNMAPWNLHERTLSQVGDNFYVNNTFPLAFFHYSGFSPEQPELVTRWSTLSLTDRPDLRPIFAQYTQALQATDYARYQSLPCYFVELKAQRERERLAAQVARLPAYRRVGGKLLRAAWQGLPSVVQRAIKKGLQFAQQKIGEFEAKA